MKILLIDCHIAVYQELRYVFSSILPNTDLECWLLSNHAHIIGISQARPDVLNATTWINLDFSLIQCFHDRYDELLSTFDAFLVGYPMSFCMLFEKYGKPIIAYNCVRYDLPFCWTGNLPMLNALNQTLADLHAKNLLTVISNNPADHDYFCNADHGVSSTLISTIGAYSGLYWDPLTTKSLSFSHEKLFSELYKETLVLVPRNKIGLYHPSFPGQFSSKLHIPYEVSTMSMYEHYQAGIPLIFPSLRFFLDLWSNGLIHVQSRYWYHHQNDINRIPLCQHITHSAESNEWWALRSDWSHNLTSVNLFSSYEELDEILHTPANQLQRLCSNDAYLRNRRLLELWKVILSKLIAT